MVADVENMSVPGGVVLPTTISMSRGSLACTHLVLSILLVHQRISMAKINTSSQIIIYQDQ